MALALTVRTDGRDYVLVEHAGESVRIAVLTDRGNQTRVIVVIMADDDSRMAPRQGWRLLRKAVREREDGGV